MFPQPRGGLIAIASQEFGQLSASLTDAAQSHQVRTARGIIADGYRPRKNARQSRRGSHRKTTAGTNCETLAASARRLKEIWRGRDSRNAKGPRSRIRQITT